MNTMTNYTTKDWKEMGYKKANEILEPMPLLERLKVLQDAPSSMTPYSHWIRKSKAELMQWYMNAMTTYSSCGGTLKWRMNDILVEEYAELMKKYSIPIPSNEVCYILGVFNGNGTF